MFITFKDFSKNYIQFNENLQLADKYYFNTGKLTDDDKEIVLDITNGDNYTKIISDFYFYYKEGKYFKQSIIIENLKLLYDDVKNYNKNIYPIVNFDIYKVEKIGDTLSSLERRREIISFLKSLPSFAQRNMRNDIRKERTLRELREYKDDFEYFLTSYSMLSNRDEKTQHKILRKMFKSETTLDDLSGFVDDKSNFIGGIDFTKEKIKELSEEGLFDIIYDKDDIMITKVESVEGIKAIGCNSLWCFTYGKALKDWQSFSYDELVYVIINFRENSNSEDFMYVLISPLVDDEGDMIIYDDDNSDKIPLFNMSNENYIDPYGVLENLFGDEYENIISNYLNFEY